MYKVSICIPVYNEENLIIKCLDSIPTRDDIEIIITEDCSTDNTYSNILDYIKCHPNKNIKLYQNDKNEGHGYSVNVCQDHASGDWLVELGSDDYLLTDNFSSFIDNELDTNYDLIYFTIQDNDGRLYKNNYTHKYAGAVKFINRKFLGNMRASPRRNGQDWELSTMMWSLNPKMKFTDIILTHWNYPKPGTISWRAQHHEIDDWGNEIKK